MHCETKSYLRQSQIHNGWYPLPSYPASRCRLGSCFPSPSDHQFQDVILIFPLTFPLTLLSSPQAPVHLLARATTTTCSGGVSAGAVAGIVIGSIVGTLLLVWACASGRRGGVGKKEVSRTMYTTGGGGGGRSDKRRRRSRRASYASESGRERVRRPSRVYYTEK